jgi:hypothetical protein
MQKLCRAKVAITRDPDGDPEKPYKAIMVSVPSLVASGSNGRSAFSALRAKAALCGFEPGERNFQLVFPSQPLLQE